MTYVFDFDGTLVDSMDTWAGVHIGKLKEAGMEVPEDLVKTITPLGNVNASKYVISLGLDTTFEEYFDDISRKLNYEYRHNVPLKSNVAETLKRLKNEGVRLAVLTASPHTYIDDCLKINGVYGLFDEVWSITDFGHTKAEVIIYEELAKRLHEKKEDCVFFDDNLTSVTTAHNAGLKTVAVYDKYSADYTEDMKKVADKYIYDFSEIFE